MVKGNCTSEGSSAVVSVHHGRPSGIVHRADNTGRYWSDRKAGEGCAFLLEGWEDNRYRAGLIAVETTSARTGDWRPSNRRASPKNPADNGGEK